MGIGLHSADFSAQHKHVLTDIRLMLVNLGFNSAQFCAQYKDSTGRDLPCFNLPKRETLILVSGYDVKMRARIIDRWQDLEAVNAPATAAPLSVEAFRGSSPMMCAR